MVGFVIGIGMYVDLLNQITPEQQANLDARAPWVYGTAAILLLLSWILILVLGEGSTTSREDSPPSSTNDDGYYESDVPAGDRPGAGRGGPGKL